MATFGSATLVLKGPKGSTTVEMSGTRISVGRDVSSDFIVTDTAVSNSHFELFKEDGTLTIRDLGSSNGTYVNGKRVQTAKLFDGDVVHIGQSQGGIAVRQANGQPMQPPPEASVFGRVMWGVAVVLFIGAGIVGWFINWGMREREELGRFEHQALELLQRQTPCDFAREAIVSLGNGGDLAVPVVLKAGKLEDDQLAAHRTLLQKTRRIEQTVSTLVGKLDARAAESNEKRLKALAWDDQLADPLLTADVKAAKDTQKDLEQQLEDATKFGNGLRDYSKAMSRFDERLSRAISSEERSPSDMDDPPSPKQAASLLEECGNNFSATNADAFKKLSSIPL